MSTDHKAAAEEIMRLAAQRPSPDGERDVEWAYREASIHATLYAAEQTAALVAQQRIANELRAAELMVDKPWLRAEIERLGLS